MKLLRVLDTGTFQRLGSNQTRRVKVRVLSATNADLKAMVRAGTFREDLYYRLNVIEVRLPPLAERGDDILPLAEHFLAGRARAHRAGARRVARPCVAGQRARAEERHRARRAAWRRAARHGRTAWACPRPSTPPSATSTSPAAPPSRPRWPRPTAW